MNQMMRMSKKELGDWHEDRNEDKEPKSRRYPVKSGKISVRAAFVNIVAHGSIDIPPQNFVTFCYTWTDLHDLYIDG